jgi:bifunctional UDP-N-acetylglucosamine pyrophosphorylase/glucosamine-1-phosphate N-acetyltransferase
MQGVGAVILAAGQGKRMRSETPKVLHCAAGRPLVRHVLDAVEEAGITEVVVVIGQGADMVREALGPQYNYALQEKQLGTGDAVLKALPHLSAECKEVLVVCGDTPLLRSETLAKLVRSRQETGAAAAVLTGIFEDPQGYGRIIRIDGMSNIAKFSGRCLPARHRYKQAPFPFDNLDVMYHKFIIEGYRADSFHSASILVHLAYAHFCNLH